MDLSATSLHSDNAKGEFSVAMKFQLGDWLIDEEANLLLGVDGETRLEKRVMAVLVELAAAEGAVVSKDTLIETVWNGAIISDHSVANAISDLRRALGDNTRNPRYIETIPKRGYRLLAMPQFLQGVNNSIHEGQDTRRRRHRWPWAAGVVLLTLAVAAIFFWRVSTPDLPPKIFLTDFDNATGDAHWDTAAAASAEMLTVVLAGGEYRLVRWRDDNFDAADVGARDRILSGRLIVDGDAPILSVQLVDGADRSTLWAASYDVDTMHFAAMARSIVADLRTPLKLEHESIATLAVSDPAIFEQYWRARYLWSLREHGAIREALSLLSNITARAPDFAPAHAAIADIYAHKTAEELGLTRQDTFMRAEQHLTRALALDPNLSDAFVSRAYLAFFRDGDIEGALAYIDNAIALRPENAIAWQTKAMIASATGKVDLSLESVARARGLDPLSASLLWDEVWFLYIAGRYEEALEAASHARRISAPVVIYEALIHLARGDEDAAFQSWLLRAKDRGLNDAALDEIAAIAQSHGAKAGLAALAKSGYSEHPVPRAALYAALGLYEEATATLLSYQRAEKSWWLSWYAVIPAFDPIRDDLRLEAFSQKTSGISG